MLTFIENIYCVRGRFHGIRQSEEWVSKAAMIHDGAGKTLFLARVLVLVLLLNNLMLALSRSRRLLIIRSRAYEVQSRSSVDFLTRILAIHHMASYLFSCSLADLNTIDKKKFLIHSIKLSLSRKYSLFLAFDRNVWVV